VHIYLFIYLYKILYASTRVVKKYSTPIWSPMMLHYNVTYTLRGRMAFRSNSLITTICLIDRRAFSCTVVLRAPPCGRRRH